MAPSIEALSAQLVATGVDPELAAWCAERLDAGDPTELLQLVLLRRLWSLVEPPDGDPAVRASQVELLAAFCRILDEGGREALEALGLPGRGWAVVASDPTRTPPGSLAGLASTLAQLDPAD